MNSNAVYKDLENRAIDNGNGYMPCELNHGTFRSTRSDRGTYKKLLECAGILSLLLLAGASGKYFLQSPPQHDLQPQATWTASAYFDKEGCSKLFNKFSGDQPVSCKSMAGIPIYNAAFDGQGQFFGCVYSDKGCHTGQVCFNDTTCASLDGKYGVTVHKK